MHNVLDKIESLINEWFSETTDLFRKKLKISVDHFAPGEFEQLAICLPGMAIAANYSQSALILLREGHKLPASALIRIICEFTIKVMWCTYKAKDCKTESKIRHDRWDKSTLKSQIRLLKKGIELSKKMNKDYGFEDYLKEKLLQLEPLNCRSMPSVIDLCEELDLHYKDPTFLLIYMDLCRAVHIDLGIIADSVDFREENIINFTGDDISKTTMPHLASVLLRLNYYFFLSIYNCFGWNFTNVQQQYFELKQELPKIPYYRKEGKS